MSRHSLALNQIQLLLGHYATDDTLWRDLRLFETTALPMITAAWELDQIQDGTHWHALHPRDEAARALHARRIAEVVDQIAAMLGTTAGSCAAAFFFSPQLWQPAYSPNRYNHFYNHQGQIQLQLLRQVAEAYLARQTPPDWIARVCQRMLTLCTAANSADQPDLATCVGYLLARDDAETAPLLDALASGDWEAAWRALSALAGRPHQPLIDQVMTRYRVATSGSLTPGQLRGQPVEELKIHWQERGARLAIALLARLHRRQRLDGMAFRQLLETLPGSLGFINLALVNRPDNLPDAFIAHVQRLLDAVLWEMLCDLRAEAWPTLCQLRHLSGGRVLLRLVEETDRQGLTKLAPRMYRADRLAGVLRHLFDILRRRDEDNSAGLTALLRQVSASALLAALPHARPYEAELCAALGWAGSEALVALLHRIEETNPTRSTDPSAGVVRRQEILDIVAPMDEEHQRGLLDSFAECCPAAVLLVRATLGSNRKDVRRLFGRRNQLAARALPLLPIDKPEEVLQRYLMLTKYQREANGSGASRKAYERAAAQAGLANLADHAGYADVTRLEWAMEDKLGAESVALGRGWEIEGYTLTLVLRESGPAIEVRSPKRLLKRTPPAVTRDYAYREVRATLEQAQDQERRYRLAFLNAMRSGQPLSADELALLRRNPLATALLERLVLIDAAGAVGLFRAADCSLEGAHGERVLVGGAVTVAHPYALAQAGLLADWQAEIVRRQIVQPFKQIFRELYILTPAEREAAYSSARLAGRRLKGRQAIAVLANLGWVVDGYSTVRKPFYDLGYAAHFETGSYADYDEDDGATSGTLTFWPLKYDYSCGDRERRVKLADVPPLVFSEVLRDLDAVTAIAHQSEESGTSKEVLQQRGDLVRATVAALGLAQVRVEEPHVYVRGQLTGYRIHLATGAIYMDSGQYLCIVPSTKERKAIYLPFEDGGEPIGSEIISKVLMLANDARITDSSILIQIPPVRQAA